MTVASGYICRHCGLDKEIQVRERHQNESLKHYIDHLARECSDHHSLLSPVCRPKKLDLKFPLTKNGFGFAGELLTQEEMKDIVDRINDRGGKDG